jgi:hypothetical protein
MFTVLTPVVHVRARFLPYSSWISNSRRKAQHDVPWMECCVFQGFRRTEFIQSCLHLLPKTFFDLSARFFASVSPVYCAFDCGGSSNLFTQPPAATSITSSAHHSVTGNSTPFDCRSTLHLPLPCSCWWGAGPHASGDDSQKWLASHSGAIAAP